VRVLVTGAAGLVGGRLATLLARQGFQVKAGQHLRAPPAGLDPVPFDLLSPASVEAALKASRVDAVLHSATFGGSEECERRPEQAHALNVTATRSLAALCRSRGLRLVALSTDQVLAGDRAWFPETEPARPLMVYGRTKLEGEEAALEAHPEAAIVRLPLMLGRGHGARGTATETILWALRAGRSVRLYEDEFRTPLDPESAAAALGALLRGKGAGLFHLGGSERVSRIEIGRRVAEAFGLPPSLLEAVPRSTHAGPPRPVDVSLDSTRARTELGFVPRPLGECVVESRPEAG
jgi:dTDP-4-dehydrorhamnose reductase